MNQNIKSLADILKRQVENNLTTELPEYSRGGPVSYYDYMLQKQKKEDNEGFGSKLARKSMDYFTSPANILSTIGTGAELWNMFNEDDEPEPKSGRELGLEELEYNRARQFTPEEMVGREKALAKLRRLDQDELSDYFNYLSDIERRQWEARNNLGLGEHLQIDPVYRKQNDEDEFKRTGRWFEYYNDPEFKSKRVYMAEGGEVHPKAKGFTEIEIAIEPSANNIFSLSDVLKQIFNHNHGSGYEDFASGFIDGEGSGQDDMIDARVSPGEYIFDSEFVNFLGDGSSKEGARRLDKARQKIREFKRSAPSDEIPPSISEFFRSPGAKELHPKIIEFLNIED